MTIINSGEKVGLVHHYDFQSTPITGSLIRLQEDRSTLVSIVNLAVAAGTLSVLMVALALFSAAP